MKGWLVVVIACAASGASAGPLADAISRHDKADIAALRAKLPDVAARCTLGAVYARLDDKVRAALFLDGCDAVTLDPEIADDVAREKARIDRELDASQLSRMTIDSDPPGVAVTTDALPGEPLVTPATVWMAAGTYTISSADHSMKVEIARHARGPIIFDRGIERIVKTKKSTEVDFTSDTIESDTTAQPPDQKHPSMLPCKYSGCETHAGDQLDDPFETKLERLPIEPPMLELGVRAGASDAFHSGGNRLAPSLAVDGRMRVGGLSWLGPAAIDVRLDWAQRGGDDGGFDAFGASAQYGAVVFAPRAAWLSALVGIRGVLRTGDMLDAMPIERAGIGYTAALELALRALPLVVGLRYDEDLTDLVPGIRERAVIVELGGELRAGLRY